jgi:DUF917 family protein
MSEYLVTEHDLDDIAAGAAILGTGGGGDPHIGRLLAAQAVRTHGPVRVVGLDSLADDATLLPVAMMGAPTVMLEKLPSNRQASIAVEALSAYLGRPATHLVCMEIGGLNALVPIVAAATLGLPLIDGDGMGRAFPELQMTLPTLYGVSATPMSIADDKGNKGIFDTVDNHWTERLARSATIDMGCSTMVSLYPMTGAEARESLVGGTLALSAELGRAVRAARSAHDDPVAAVARTLGGVVLFNGKIVDVSRRTESGFARGLAVIEGLDEHSGKRVTIEFQNENLVITREDEVLATVPDLICVLETDTGLAITTEQLRFGHRVRVVVAPSDPRWHLPAGIELVGPRYFGYDTDPVRVLPQTVS